MVEMVETAAILNQATRRSFVILDEIGRGTATHDGLAIAWASVEHLHDVNGCRALFATHYHELTALAARLADLGCHTMRVREWQGSVVFLHEVAPGRPTAPTASTSPVSPACRRPPSPAPSPCSPPWRRARRPERRHVWRMICRSSRCCARRRPHGGPTGPSPVETALAALDLDELTPRQALDRLYALKDLLP